MSTQRPPPTRVYTCLIDGKPFSEFFLHPAGLEANELSRDLNRQFHEWLEKVAPGAFAEGRVSGIGFSDSPN
jgi:hypothetical protein